MKFVFEPDLTHQKAAIDAVVDLFAGQQERQSLFTIAPGQIAGELEYNERLLGYAKASLQGDVDTLRAKKESLNLEKQLFENERAEFDEVRNTHTISVEMLASVFGSNKHARMNENTLEVFAPGQFDGVPQVTMDATRFAPWLPALVDTYAGYNEQWFSLGKIEKQLADHFRTLAEQYPEKRTELRAQAEQIKALAAPHQKPMWQIPDQQGGVGG